MAQAVSPPPDGGYSDVGGAAPEVAQRYDFNGDGHPDYVLLNDAQTAIWYLNNNIYQSGALAPVVPFSGR